MIFDIIKTINGKVKFCLKTQSEYYFIEGFILKDETIIEFRDSINNKITSLTKDVIESSSLTTFGENTIPTQVIIDEINSGNNNFFTENEDNHTTSNDEFYRLANDCKKYITYFKSSEKAIKTAVIENNTRDLERLKILGADRVISLPHASVEENLDIRHLYWKLIDKKLNEAIAEIDSSLEGIDDEDFIADANIIKNDLEQNVADFRDHMKGVTYDKLFHQWPTLLNPSPFSDV